MLSLAVGIIAGFLIVMPFGPINVCVLATGLRRGFRPALAVGLGAALMDFTYFLAISSGLSLIAFSPSTTTALKAAGIIVLLGIGILLIRSPGKREKEWPAGEQRKEQKSHFLVGVVLYASNPTLVTTLSFIIAGLRSFELFRDSPAGRFLLSLGAGLGSALWYWLLAHMTVRYSRKLSKRVVLNISRVCGVIVILLAFWMGRFLY